MIDSPDNAVCCSFNMAQHSNMSLTAFVPKYEWLTCGVDVVIKNKQFDGFTFKVTHVATDKIFSIKEIPNELLYDVKQIKS